MTAKYLMLVDVIGRAPNLNAQANFKVSREPEELP